jgi:hypothetical protein
MMETRKIGRSLYINNDKKMKNEKFSTAHSRRVQEDRWINYKQKRSTTSWQNI